MQSMLGRPAVAHAAWKALVLASGVLLAACGGGGAGGEAAKPVLTAGTLGEQVVLTPAEWLDAAPYAAADIGAGQRIGRVCLACHSLGEGGANMIGPNLYGFFGREVGSVDGFDYSAALDEASFTWTPRALDAWLRQPAKFLPGNRMTYPGVPNASDRDDLIAYLLAATNNPAQEETTHTE